MVLFIVAATCPFRAFQGAFTCRDQIDPGGVHDEAPLRDIYPELQSMHTVAAVAAVMFEYLP